ncbi:hypothetical protein niasHT_018274 [Heterodera trifolii]|uniref:Uncharacterized protein n=1 Tax=Heterodera trifolii TaxID=157864 RepID=A0ABD2L8P9_9BILA
MLMCCIEFDEEKWTTKINGLIAAFSAASSAVNFIIAIAYSSATDAFIVPFNLTNALTGERLTLNTTKNKYGHFLLIRCPISRDENKWTNWEKEALELAFWNQWNTIEIAIVEEEIGECLIDGTSADPSDPNGQRKCFVTK